MTMTGGFVKYSSLKGLNYNFPEPQSPQEISFNVRSGSTTLAGGYFAVGTGSNGWDIPIWFYMSGNGLIYANGDTTFSYDANTWYKIRFDIDWDGQTFDLYVDDQPVSMGIALRDSQTSFSTVYLINPDGSQSWWDAIQFDSSLRSPVAINPSEEEVFSSGDWVGSVTVFQPDLDETTTTDPLSNDSDGDTIFDGIEDANFKGRWDVTETAANVASGDYDLSKVVDLRDLLPVLQIVAGETPGGLIEVSADTNGDHIIGLTEGIYESVDLIAFLFNIEANKKFYHRHIVDIPRIKFLV
ncbi:MAG: hypothetical protein GY702_00140 [Desulfobulbaceae bacterium]|nr:hypothetical protein [Desulfobulbaceae bacterium]